ncbi:MAG TPA: phosphopantetheine-binding protein, partial [Candidatus Kapabacteria bacterium]|nr:phosphopantetheine-binding protein [Candidatus Kapabacteria bacterium]
PANEIEEKLTQIWAKVLGIEKEKISTRQNFFEMGGTSLNLIKQLSLINKEFGIEVTANQIYQNPTIQAIAGAIRAHKFIDVPVVLLNQPGKKKVFCFPPGSGFGIAYQAMANIINDFSFYSFNFIENENRLNEYVENITRLQPAGPYTLFGWSAAGRLIFEVAGVLEYHNREVSDIVLLDCLFINYNNTIDEEKFEKQDSESLEKESLEFVEEKVRKKADEYINYLKHTNALEVIHANVHLIISEDNQNNSKHDIRCWDKLTTKPVLIYNGFGSHNDMLIPGPLEKNAKVIENILKS